MATNVDDLIKQRRQERNIPLTPEQSRSIGIVENPEALIQQRIIERKLLQQQGIESLDPTQQVAESRQELFQEQAPGPVDLGAREAPTFRERFDLGISDTFEEKKAKFLDKHPDGDFIVVADKQGAPSVLFRRNQSEPFAEFDDPRFEILGDVLDFSGELPAIAIEVAISRGGGLVANFLQAFTGVFFGQVAKESVEELRGFQFETFEEQGARTTRSAFAAGTGAAVTRIFTGPINILRGAGTMKIAEGARRAAQAARDLDIPGLMPSQIARSPLLRKLGGQSQATVSSIGEYIEQQNDAAVNALIRLQDSDLDRFLVGNLEELNTAAREQILTAARFSRQPLTEGGTAIQAGIAEYDNLARASVNRAYADARALADPKFDITPVKGVANEIQEGVQGLTVGGTPVQLQRVGADLQSVIDDINALDPTLPQAALPSGAVATSTDQLRALRQRLWDLKTPAPGEIRREPQVLAGKLYSAITRQMRNIENTDEAFVSAWTRADKLASQRFDTMEKLIVMKAVKDETPALLASRLAKPLQVDNLKLLQATTTATQYRVFQDAVKTDLVAPQNISKLTQRLNNFDKETLDLLLSRAEQNALRDIGKQMDNLKALDIEGVLERQVGRAAIVKQLTNAGDTRGIRELLKRLPDNPEAPIRKELRAGLIDDIVNSVVVKQEGARIINNNALKGRLANLRQSGAIDLLTKGDLRVLDDLSDVMDFIPARADSGTSIQAASTAAGVRELSATAFQTLLETIGLGRVMTSGIGQRILTGTGVKKLAFGRSRVIGAILAQTNEDISQEKESLREQLR